MSNHLDKWVCDVDDTILANATNSSTIVELGRFTTLAVQVAWSFHDDTSTFELQSSLDGTNYDTIEDTPTTTVGVSGSETLLIPDNPFKFLKLVITDADANAAASYAITFFGKNNK